jgi:hypothetical protein
VAKGDTRAHVVMPRETVEAIDRLVGRRGRSRFLAEAAEEKLRRVRVLEAADRLAGSISEDSDTDDRSHDTSRDQ